MSSKFAKFDQSDAVYKTVNGQDIATSIFVPRNASPGEHPVLLRWHGGALINGWRNLEDWFPTWIVDYAYASSAIIVNPDYRLLPESNGLDILSDLSSLFSWLHTSLSSQLSSTHPGIIPNLSSLLVTGESAGGYMALQSLLLASPSHPPIAAVIAHFPMIDLREKFYSEAYPKQIFNEPYDPKDSPEALAKHLAAMKPGIVVTKRVPKDHETDLYRCMLYEGKYTTHLDSDTSLFPRENLARMGSGRRAKVPLWIFHGTADTVVPARGTEVFVKELKEMYPEWDVLVQFVEEAEHGFDEEANKETLWVKEGLEWMTKYWPGSKVDAIRGE